MVGVLVASFALHGDAQQPSVQRADQEPASPAQERPPIFRTGINFVRVDVIVSDKQGSAVLDLQPGDFDVSEEGKTQKIESFKLIKLDGTLAAADGPPRAIRSDYQEEAEAARDDVRLFGIFLDDYHVRFGTSARVREPLARFVEQQLGPADMVGIMYPLDPVSSVRMTRDHDAVARGVQRFVGRKFDYTPRNQYEEQYAHLPVETVEEIRNQVSLSAVRSFIVHMGSLKQGRKALILVSEGYSRILPPQLRDPIASMPGLGNPNRGDPFAGVGDPNEDRAAMLANSDLQLDLREIYDNANRNNVAIYTVDPRGLATNEFDIGEGVGSGTDRQYLTATADTLRTLAEQTDGRAVVGRNDLESGMKQIVRDSSAYYLIGYSSTQTPSDGKFHEIKVRVKRPGLQVRARRGYWAVSAEDVARALAPPRPATPKPVEAALAAVERPSRARVIRTWIGTSRGENGKTKVTFVWEPAPKVPGDLTSNQEPARVLVIATGVDGAPYLRVRVPEVGTNSGSAPAGRGAPGATNGQAPATSRPASQIAFEVQPGALRLRLSVEGVDAQVLDSEVRDITVPDLTSAQTMLGTPVVLRARTPREYQQIKADLDAVPVATREFRRSDRLLVRVPAYGPGNAVPATTARLLNRAGQQMLELPVSRLSGAADSQQIDLPLAGLPPGEYVVEFKATSEGGEAESLVGFRVGG